MVVVIDKLVTAFTIKPIIYEERESKMTNVTTELAAFEYIMAKEREEKKIFDIINCIKALINRINPIKTKYLNNVEVNNHVCRFLGCNPENERTLISKRKLSSYMIAKYQYTNSKGELLTLQHDNPHLVRLRTDLYICEYGFIHVCSSDKNYLMANNHFKKKVQCYKMEEKNGRLYCGVSNKHGEWKIDNIPYGHMGCNTSSSSLTSTTSTTMGTNGVNTSTLSSSTRGRKRGRGRGRGSRGRNNSNNNRGNSIFHQQTKKPIANNIINKYNENKKVKFDINFPNGDIISDNFTNGEYIRIDGDKKRLKLNNDYNEFMFNDKKKEEKGAKTNIDKQRQYNKNNNINEDVTVLTIPIKHKKEKHGIGMRRRTIGKAKRKKRITLTTTHSQSLSPSLSYITTTTTPLTNTQRQQQQGLSKKSILSSSSLIARNAKKKTYSSNNSGKKRKNDGYYLNLTAKYNNNVKIIKNDRKRKDYNVDELSSLSTSSSSSSLVTHSSSICPPQQQQRAKPALFTPIAATTIIYSPAAATTTVHNEKTEFKCKAREIIMKLFYSKIRSQIYQDSIDKQNDNIKKIIKRLYVEQLKSAAAAAVACLIIPPTIVTNNKHLDTNGNNTATNNNNNTNLISSNKYLNYFESFLVFCNNVHDNYIGTPQLEVNNDFIQFFCNIAWAQWRLITNSPYGRQQTIRLNPTNICLALLYMIRKGGKTINDRQVIPICEYAGKYTPFPKDLEAYGYHGHNITAGTRHLNCAYQSILKAPGKQLPYEELQNYQWFGE